MPFQALYNIMYMCYVTMHTHHSDWYPAPTTLHIVDEHQTNSQPTAPSSGYPINRYRHRSLPRSASHCASIQYTSTPPHSIKYATQHTYTFGQHSRSTTSPEVQQGDLTRPPAPPLQRGYSASTLHSDYPVHGQPISDGHSHTLNRNQPSYSVKHPHNPAGAPKGIDSWSNSAIQHSSYRNTQDIRGQGSQTDSRSLDMQSMEYFPYDTMSEHNLSDSTQNSDISEPTYQRPKYAHPAAPFTVFTSSQF